MVAVWACWAPSSVAGPQEERKGAGPWKQREEKGNTGVGWLLWNLARDGFGGFGF